MLREEHWACQTPGGERLHLLIQPVDIICIDIFPSAFVWREEGAEHCKINRVCVWHTALKKKKKALINYIDHGNWRKEKARINMICTIEWRLRSFFCSCLFHRLPLWCYCTSSEPRLIRSSCYLLIPTLVGVRLQDLGVWFVKFPVHVTEVSANMQPMI